MVTRIENRHGLPAFLSKLNPEWLAGLALLLLCVVVYTPVWQAGFVWDDNAYIVDNSNLIGLHGLEQIWTTSAADVSPLSLTTFWVEHALWGLTPGPYHFVNVLAHGACAVVLWRVLLSLRVPGAWIGAALWAVHPVEVESVAWVTELKNSESGICFLLAILYFVRWLRAPSSAGRVAGKWDYPLALIFAALALACKSSTVILPPVLCLCAWWIEGRWRWRNLKITAPFFVLAALDGIITFFIVRGQLSSLNNLRWEATWPQRFVTAGEAVWFYLGKVLWPHPIATMYPGWLRPSVSVLSLLPFVAVVAVLFFLWTQRHGPLRGTFFAFAYFVVALVPVLGFIQHYILQYSLVFDHFQYLASMGPMALIGAGILRVSEYLFAERRAWMALLPAAMIAALGVTSWERTWVYQNAFTYWGDALAKNPQAWVGNEILGAELIKAKQTEAGMAQLQRSIAIYPDYEPAHKYLGDAYLDLGRTDAAVAEYKQAVMIRADYTDARVNLGGALLLQGKVDEAIDQLREALKTHANFQAHVDLASALYTKGDLDGAISEFREARALNPENAGVKHSLDLAVAKKATNAEMAKYQQAVTLNPHDADARYQLGNVYLAAGNLEAAMAQYRAVLAIDAKNVKAHNNLGVALAQAKRPGDAIPEFEAALKLDPSFTDAQQNLNRAKAAASAGK
jgi:tetratricopeptide (TPR) repeat protein